MMTKWTLVCKHYNSSKCKKTVENSGYNVFFYARKKLYEYLRIFCKIFGQGIIKEKNHSGGVFGLDVQAESESYPPVIVDVDP